MRSSNPRPLDFLDAKVARRFVLGCQGLWPGRRWEGADGVVDAVLGTGGVQVDPLDIVGHSHDVAFLGRVEGYRPRLLEDCLYRRRRLFEWGGTVFIRPMSDLPFWRRRMAS